MKKLFASTPISLLPALLISHVLAAAVPWVVIKAAPLVELPRPPALILAGLCQLGVAGLAGWRLARALHALAEQSGPLAEGRVTDLGSVVTTRIAEVRMLARRFLAVTERLRAQLTYNREFASHVAHEFKTPLTTLRGTLELLAEDEPLPPTQRAIFLDNARTDLDRMQAMVEGLLELARAEEAEPGEEVDLDALAAELELPVVGHAGVVRGDARLLAVALRNLVDNARAYGAEPIRIHLAPGEVVVEDQGPGISAVNLGRIFERFFTTSADRRGTGLGLPLVRAVARAHGGDAFAESRPGLTRIGMRGLRGE